MDKEDKDVLAKFITVLGVLVLIAVISFLVARLASTVDHNRTAGADTDEFAQMQLDKINQRIAAVGKVVAGEIPSGPVVRSGKEITEAICNSCHTAGVLGAPKMGEAGDWATRMTAGLDAVVTAAINGKGNMPARGGDGSLSDDDVRKAVIYMLNESGQEVGDGAASTPATESQPAADAAATTEATAKTEPEAAAVTETTVAVAAPAAAGGEAEKIYKTACFSCHDSGVANAPKLGDKAAWADRITAGTESMYQAAIGGKGAMPPKGGRMDLSDDAIKAVVDYMVTLSQ